MHEKRRIKTAWQTAEYVHPSSECQKRPRYIKREPYTRKETFAYGKRPVNETNANLGACPLLV